MSAVVAAQAAQRKRTVGVLFALAFAPCFAMSAIFGKFALNAGGAPIGILAARFALAAALPAALLALMGKRWPRGRTLGTLLAVGAIGQGAMAIFFFNALFGIAAAVSLCGYVLAAKRYTHDIDPYVSTTVFIAGAALVFIVMAALPRLAASDVTTLMTIEPVVTMVFGWWLLGETVGWIQFAGAVLILGSVLVLARSVRRA